MIRDTYTVIWKELKEIVFARDNLRSGILTAAFLIGALGVYEPWKLGPTWIGSPIMLFSFIIVPLALELTMLADSIAGERERRTLETLLASRLSDRAILFGKMGAAVGYAGSAILLMLIAGVISLSLFHGQGAIVLYPAHIGFGVLGFGLLVSLFAAGAGMLASMYAASVQQAQQRLGLLVVWLLPIAFFIGPLAPAGWKTALAQALAPLNGTYLVPVVFFSLCLIDSILIAVALARFRRARLILD